MSRSVRVHLNPTAPYVLQVTVSGGDVQYQNVTAASFSVREPDATETTWAASITAQSSTSITLTHSWNTGEADTAGAYYVRPLLTTPSGVILCELVTLIVEQEWQ